MDKVKQIWEDLKAKVTGKPVEQGSELVTTVATTYEINLVPEIKAQMIRAQKIRNLVLFICIVVSVASVGVVLVLFGIKSGQDIAMSNQDKKLNTMSAKLNGFDELGDLVTLQTQLRLLEEIGDNKTVPSRVFGALGVMLPKGEDVVQLSDLRIDLEKYTLRLEGQADARVAPLIDYRVLESFKKGVALTKYDYGRFVDVNGNEIPTWCIVESDADGNAYKSGESYYAWWDLSLDGCAAYRETAIIPEGSKVDLFFSKDAEVETEEVELDNIALEQLGAKVTVGEDGNVTIDVSKITVDDVEAREVDGGTKYFQTQVKRVKVWRTPQFTAWHNGGLMELDGSISGIEHFESKCYTYSGTMQKETGVARWTSTNDCMLAPEGLTITSSSNGRDESDNLVLKFSASASVSETFFMFSNKHMIAIGPMGQNVTDSYLQVGGMFTQAAEDCGADDAECLTNSTNTGGNKSNE